jgi:beta-mannosidase
VWHGLQDVKYYRKRKTRFCSEFGFESLPDMKTIEKYADKEDYSITSKVFLAHQKCMLGNQKMEYYITSRFRLPKNFEDYVYLSQACQMECIKDATEFWRRNRDRSNGSLYWQLNDCWPVCSWSSIDYYGNYKALQYHAKHFFNPIMVSIEGDKKGVKVYLLNDTLQNVKGKLILKVVDFNSGVVDLIESNHDIGKLSVQKVYDIPMRDFVGKYKLDNVAIVCDLLVGDVTVNTKTFLFKNEKYLNLNKVEYQKEVRVENGTVYITLTSNKFARLVRVTDRYSMQPFSDNWFDLLPGESKTITLPYYEGFNVNNLEIISSVDVQPKGSKLYDNLIKAKFILNPVNLAIYVAQPRSNFDYKE